MGLNVHEAAIKRIAVAFRDFDNVLVAFSCGKDSGVLLSLTHQYAKENGCLDRLYYYYQDYEANYQSTHDYAERVFNDVDAAGRYWICLPISAACSVSMYEPRWIPWDKDKEDIWVRPMPDSPYVINEENCPFPFKKGMKGFDMRIDFGKWFARENGSTAVFVGLRADESLTRRAIFTSKHRSEMHKGLKYTKTVDENTTNFYPIYDWRTSDIWVCNAKFGFDYNKIYDLYYQAGLTVDQMRVASPFHHSGQENLKLYRVIDPNNWAKMVGRVNGCNFGGIYGGTTAMGWRTITKPNHFSWRQYAEFLMETLPADTKKKLKHHLSRLADSWKNKGYGRNPRVINEIKQAGVDIEVTDQISNLCKKEDVYRIIKINGDWPDEIKIKDATPFRHCPNWKAVCITIMKNDFSCQYMGMSRNANQKILRESGLDKYAKLKNIKKETEK